MRLFYFDSSALAKAYVKEKGSDIVEHLLKSTTFKQWRVLMLGLLETISILVRRKNNGVISKDIFSASFHTLRRDFIDNSEVFKIETTSSLAKTASSLIENYSVNATAAVVLRSALDIATHERKQNNELILVSADERLLTAARAEGLPVINPETATLAEIEQLLQADSPAQSNGE